MIERIAEACGQSVSRETCARLQNFVRLLLEENERQNLVARSTIESVWERHVVDSAQLTSFAPPGSRWGDIGSGPGLPGMVVAILTGDPVTLIEPRRGRVEFLTGCSATLGLDNVTVLHGKAEQCRTHFDVITARAVAPLADLLGMTSHLAHSGTKWVLPKGLRAKSELDDALRSWQGRFELMPSLTSADASIVVVHALEPRGKR